MPASNKIIKYGGTILLSALILFCYGDVLRWMYERYLDVDSYYSHGFLVPFISLFLIWRARERVQQIELRASWLGLVFVCLSLSLHIVGSVIYIYSLSGFSLFFLIIGLSLFLFGSQLTRIIAFPLIFLVFMIPLPIAFISMISYPLKMLAAKCGAWSVEMMGIPVLREGFNISIPTGNLIVGNPCSGLRSLISFLALGALFAHLTPLPLVRKWVLFVISVPIALLVNIVRVVTLILVSHFWGLAAAAPDTMVHTGSGLVIFVIGFLLLVVSSKVLE